jgi:DNA end-binding protein Ku
MAARTRRRSSGTKKAKPSTRASWKGNLSFGLVNFPVQAINAFNREQSDIHFHQLHATCHRRVQYKKVCPVHGELSQDEIVSGYEVKKGKYVEVTEEELDALQTERERTLTIDAFVDENAIDPIYFDGRMYYLAPDGDAAAAPYAVVLTAFKREARFGIGQLVFSGKEQLALLRPLEGALQMVMLNYDEEIRSVEDVMSVSLPKTDARQLKLAQTLIRNWTTDEFDFEHYDDEYRERVESLIKAKSRGKEVAIPENDGDEPKIVNLMEALKQSLAVHKPGRTARRRKHTARKTG